MRDRQRKQLEFQPVVANQSFARAKPDETVARLPDGTDFITGKAVLRVPGAADVLLKTLVR